MDHAELQSASVKAGLLDGTYGFRLMQEQDLDAVATLVKAASEFGWSARKIQDSLISPHDTSYLLYETQSSSIIGYAVLHFVMDECHLLNIAIAKPSQGKGLGSLLLSRLIEQIRSESYRSVFLEVRASNIAAIRLYEKLGFVRSGLRKGYYPAADGREDAVLYFLSLD